MAIVYCFPQVKHAIYFPLAKRFADTWLRFPPGQEPHTLYVGGNGGPVPPQSRSLFRPGTQFLHHDNTGLDIGLFQLAAETIPCDLLVCLGAPVHFHRSGWLERMVGAYLENGPALYGCWSYLSPDWHVRTTVFWFPPQLLQTYPLAIGNTRSSRYDFEHGPHSFTRHVLKHGLDCIMVTQKGCFPFSQWQNHAPGVEDSLVLDQHVHR